VQLSSAEEERQSEEYLREYTNRPTFHIRTDFLLWGSISNKFLFDAYISNTKGGGIILDHFEALLEKPDTMNLSAGGLKMLNTPNAGGNSVWSEVLSYELLRATYGAQLRRTEMEIEYWPASKITDYSVTVLGRHIGVSVTRAINFLDLSKKFKAPFTSADAHRLLCKKLFGVLASSNATVDKWEKQILHIWTTSKTAARLVVQEYYQVDPTLRADTVVVVTLAKNADWLF